MYCHKCGKEIPDNSDFCNHCVASVNASGKSIKHSLLAGIAAGVIIIACLGLNKGYAQEYSEKNPTINLPQDITDGLILESLLKQMIYK